MTTASSPTRPEHARPSIWCWNHPSCNEAGEKESRCGAGLHSDQGFQYTSQAYGITPSMSRKGNHIKLPDNRSCIPDIVCCMKNEMEYYEVECGNHHQSDFNDKCDKLKSITSNLFFVAPNRETVEKKLKPQIEAWIRTHGIQLLQISGVVVYLTSISDLAAGRWTYVYNMQDEKPIFTSSNTQKKE